MKVRDTTKLAKKFSVKRTLLEALKLPVDVLSASNTGRVGDGV
jgi:hypothetical protein